MTWQGWTIEADAELKRRVMAGESFGQISRAMQCGTRNASLGRAYRLGLTGKNRPHKAPSAPKVRPLPGGNPIGPKLGEVMRRTHAPCEPAVVPFVDRSAGEVGAITDLLDLRDAHCKWPLGSRPYTFCGAGREGDGPYCTAHARDAFRPQDPRKTETARSLRRYL